MRPELQEAIEKARTGTVAANLLTVELISIIEELRELKINLSLELQATRDQWLAEYREWRELAAALRELIVNIQANERINQCVLHLIQPAKKTGEERCQNGKKTSSRRSLRGKFASNTH